MRGHHVNEEVMYEELMYKEKNPPINRETEQWTGDSDMSH